MSEEKRDWRFRFMRPVEGSMVEAGISHLERTALTTIARLVEVTVGDTHWLEDTVSAVRRMVEIATEPPNTTELDGGDDGRIHRFRMGSKFSLCRDANRWGDGARGLCLDCDEIDRAHL